MNPSPDPSSPRAPTGDAEPLGTTPPDAAASFDPTAAADLFQRWHEPVLERLARAYPAADREAVHDAFVLALLDHCKAPGRFDPSRGTLEQWLYGSARRELLGLMRSEARRRRREREKTARAVAGAPSAARSIAEQLADAELAQRARQEVARTDAERDVLRLWEQGVVDLRAYARALGIEDRGEAEQAAVVKRVRDRLLQRLRRLKGRFDEEGTRP
ncbi:MAG TPA: hypothetical protein VF590_02125 [Isosphaeraceae bacterium]|jgi:hypothetical protein